MSTNDSFAIHTVDLTKIFAGRTCVDRLNLKVAQGELYALLGDNGAGKTTTVNMLTSLVAPTQGRFFISGFDGTKDPEKIKGTFGIVSQDVAVYNELTAYENLRFIADLYEMKKGHAETRIQDLLSKSGLADRANDRVGTFSGGMQRKLAIASALLHEPSVLFMDEPTVGLDPVARRQIWETLTELKNSGVTILLTTHYLEEAELLADRIGIIREGRLVAEGSIQELRHMIRGIRQICVRLTEVPQNGMMDATLAELRQRFNTDVEFDRLRQTIKMTQPEEKDLSRCLSEFLAWLNERDLPFTRFSTNEPNLEEVFIAFSRYKDGSSLLDGIESSADLNSREPVAKAKDTK